MDVDLSLFRVLADLGETGSMTATAERMAYTPSAISQRVRRLEEAVGAPVLERHARGVRLTQAGERVVACYQDVAVRMATLEAELDDLAGARTGRVGLGVFPTFAASFLPLVMARFGREHPHVDLSIRSSRLRRLRRLLDAREIDLMLGWDYPDDPFDDAQLDVVELGSDPTVLLAPAGHWLVSSGPALDVGRLATERWVVRADAHPITRVLLVEARHAGFEPVVLTEANDYLETQAMVAAGLGLAVVPRTATRFLRGDIAAVPVEGWLPPRRLLVAQLAERSRSPAAAAMIGLLGDVVASD